MNFTGLGLGGGVHAEPIWTR